ncbi:BhlA/UviB family holin-like peptide [Mycobacteroides abscessus]|uniref:BhlA/UviB family holin-like peptide n=1 Tax=Mycobacteroides abscessus TaxID=36809 RepID=UPI0034CE453D
MSRGVSMDANLMQYFLTQGPFAVLFVWLFYTSRKESQEREKQLYQTIDDQNEILKGFSSKYDIVITKLDDIEERLPPR